MTHYIVGIGASAGGLEALFALLPHLKPNGSVSYVIAQHMAHDGHSELMQKLLNRCAHIDVALAQSGQKLLPDHIYLIPAGNNGVISEGCIHLQSPAEGHVSTPSINVLFQSIAQSFQTYAIGVVLSGTGSDGVVGCRAIKKLFGITFAQDPSDAIFNGMPSSAIEAKVIDQILSPKKIAEAITQVIQISPNMVQAESSKSTIQPKDEDVLLYILEFVLEKTKINFIGYRTETLRRRLDNRMVSIQVDGLSAYYSYLQTHPNEVFHIQQLFLVSFSYFFRDAESFNVLAQHLFEVVRKKDKHDTVNIWVAGCASGEEVYTIAIILYEIKLKLGLDFLIQVKGSDLNSIALTQALSGAYPIKAIKEMDRSLVKKYFVQKGDLYIVNNIIKSLCHFEQANVFEFNQRSCIDLVSCRNLLIYLKSPLQDQLITKFHQALTSDGVLFLGQSESLSPSSNTKFKQVSLSHRLYVRK